MATAPSAQSDRIRGALERACSQAEPRGTSGQSAANTETHPRRTHLGACAGMGRCNHGTICSAWLVPTIIT